MSTCGQAPRCRELPARSSPVMGSGAAIVEACGPIPPGRIRHGQGVARDVHPARCRADHDIQAGPRNNSFVTRARLPSRRAKQPTDSTVADSAIVFPSCVCDQLGSGVPAHLCYRLAERMFGSFDCLMTGDNTEGQHSGGRGARSGVSCGLTCKSLYLVELAALMRCRASWR